MLLRRHQGSIFLVLGPGQGLGLTPEANQDFSAAQGWV